MYFKKLELVGFKSFADKTTLHFENGITAIVGPNGTGKSNVMDSLRWVLGEQSAKSLRGSDMQDVIFNGTDTKEALGLAEVSLTFDNEKKFFNVDAPEVTITRRLFRSGESEYLLNKSNVRLKDILDILLGTGIGAESYSIVAQGKIDLVLSSRPEDRRVVFDEASGITKYKSQKREATRKLEETEQNLLRVNDIVTEVKRQIGSLERQANKARRYKEVFEELKTKEINLSLAQKQELAGAKDDLVEQLRKLEGLESGLLELIRGLEEKMSGRQEELKSLEEKMLGAKNAVLNLENQAVRDNEHVGFNRQRLEELAQEKKYLLQQAEQTKNKLVADEDKLNSVRSEFASLQDNINQKQALLSEKETQINALALAIKNSLDKISAGKKDILDLVSRIAAAKNQIGESGSQQQVYLARKKRLEIEKAKVYEERVTCEDSLNNAIAETEALKQAVEALKDRIRALENEIENEGLNLADIDSKVFGIEKQLLSLQSHREFLEKLKTQYEDIGETMNAVIYLDKLPQDNVSGLVVKIKEQSGLSDEDKAYFDAANFRVRGEAKPVELDTRKIEEKIRKLQDEITALRSSRQAKEAQVTELKNTLIGFQREERQQEISLANKESLRQSIQEQFNKIKEEEDITVLELAEVERELAVLEKNLQALQAGLNQLNNDHLLKADGIQQEEDRITSDSRLREEVLVAITQAKTEVEALGRRIVSDEATLKILEGTFAQDKDSLDNVEKQLNDISAKGAQLQQEIADCSLRINQTTLQIKEQAELLTYAETQYREVADGSSGEAQKLEQARTDIDKIKAQLYELQMQNKDIDYRYVTLKTRMQEAYKIDLDTVTEAAPIEVSAEALAQEIAGLKAKLDSYGTVNLVAIEEYDELKKRYDFLIQQETDLNNAKESLHQAILKINRTTKQMFMETFEKVREEFRNYFRLLFAGGDAQLFLIDEQDPLESGIEIICRPPGKKLQNVLLLSGGEKSMSAIALIFAIFKVKPSPFCVLDEIDAALDEANVDRFSRILQEFAKSSQFIVITHNKKTIANADVMYGITMEQSGISKIVSVKFAKNGEARQDKAPEAVAA
jgi:chromosome segregation protein